MEQFETGLLQNHWRDYDPTLGRYLDADPIGLAGGANPFGYAYADPMHHVDPTGEFAQLIVRGGQWALNAWRARRATAAAEAIARAAAAAETLRLLSEHMDINPYPVGGLCFDSETDIFGDSPDLEQCLNAAAGGEDSWMNFCNSIPKFSVANLAGNYSRAPMCRSHQNSSEVEKRNYCFNEFGD